MTGELAAGGLPIANDGSQASIAEEHRASKAGDGRSTGGAELLKREAVELARKEGDTSRRERLAERLERVQQRGIIVFLEFSKTGPI